MKLNRKWIMIIALLMSLTMATAGTLAYLADTDADVNVMTLGSVYIVQNEQERDADGNLQPFTQEKPAYPAVGPIAWAEEGVKVGETEYKVFTDELKNVIDKIVTVTNTGKSEAYVRTIIAIEAPGFDPNDMIHINTNGDEGLTWGTPVCTKIDGVDYYVISVTYDKALAPKETSVPSLMQLFLDSAAGNKDVEAFGNTWEVLVLSQAMQTQGFADAATALNEGFGEVNVDNVTKWFGTGEDSQIGDIGSPEGTLPEGWEDNNPPVFKDGRVEYNGVIYDDIYLGVEAAKTAGGTVKLLGSFTMDETLKIPASITIAGNGHTITRAEGFTGTVFVVETGKTLTTNALTLDGTGATATGNLIATEGSGSIVLNEGTVLKNNNGSHAVSLATRGGGTLTLTGAEISNNSSDSGAIWGGGHIIVNDGSKINNNSSTGSAGAIRMVSSCNLTMNGGEISNNTAASSGGAIWGYGASTYNLNGGKMSGNTAAAGGAIYTGDGSVVNVSGNFELCNNTADDAGALRLSNRTAFNMSGGKVYGNESKNSDAWDGFYGWNPGVNITGGELVDNITIHGGLTPTIGGSGITGIVHFALSTNHNTANLAASFGTFKFSVAEDDNFAAFNLKPAASYTYVTGDEEKLICMNEGYATYWNESTGTFKIQAK